MSTRKPLVLIYVEHPMCSMDCAEGVLSVLNGSGKYQAALIGPGSFPFHPITLNKLKEATMLVIPGGWGDSDQFDNSLLRSNAGDIRNYVAAGGKYLGICMGSYLAGHHYIDLLAKNTKAVQYVRRKLSTIKHEKHAVVSLDWGGQEKTVYFHDGAAFVPRKRYRRISGKIVARYRNGDAAALIQKYKKGVVGVVGPHPEAHKWWFYSQTRIRKRWRDCIHHELLVGFVESILSHP